MGNPTKFKVIELGPGKGTMMKDIIRVSKQFTKFYDALNIHMIENSPIMRSLQAQSLNVNNFIINDDLSNKINIHYGEDNKELFQSEMIKGEILNKIVILQLKYKDL